MYIDRLTDMLSGLGSLFMGHKHSSYLYSPFVSISVRGMAQNHNNMKNVIHFFTFYNFPYNVRTQSVDRVPSPCTVKSLDFYIYNTRIHCNKKFCRLAYQTESNFLCDS